MASPVLDEDWMIQLLKTPTSIDHGTDRVQAGAAQALVDLFDRKVQREFFVEHAGPCLSLYGQCAKLWILRHIKTVFDEGELTAEAFEKADRGLSDLIRRQGAEVVAIVKQLQECPADEDRVH